MSWSGIKSPRMVEKPTAHEPIMCSISISPNPVLAASRIRSDFPNQAKILRVKRMSARQLRPRARVSFFALAENRPRSPPTSMAATTVKYPQSKKPARPKVSQIVRTGEKRVSHRCRGEGRPKGDRSIRAQRFSRRRDGPPHWADRDSARYDDTRRESGYEERYAPPGHDGSENSAEKSSFENA